MGSTKEEIDDALKVMTEDWHDCIKSEAPQHKVILTQPRYLGIHEVTQAQYEKVMGENPSHFAPTGEEKEAVAGMNASRHPVETVDWNDAAEFCAKLSETETPMSDSSYQLPTEAEWEFACRAGTTTRFSVGEQDADLLRVGWFDGNSGGRTHAVGELSRNPFGIFDMNGNVWEWTQDWWGPTYYAQFQEESALDPRGASPTVVDRVIRGGHCNDPAPYCRSSFRVRYAPTTRGRNLGFRVSLSVDAVRQTLQLTGPPIPKGMATTPTAPADPDRRAAEYVLSIGGSVMVSQGGQGCWPKTVGDLPEEAFELVVVRAGGIQKVSDAALACFKDCKNLTELVLNYTPVSDAGLAHFKDCKQLAILELHGIRAGDAGLAHFKDCKQLTTLGLADTQATDAGLIHFRDCENLRVLHLRGPEVTDAGLAHFRNCKKLATLTLNANPKVSDAALAYFANLPKLTSVDVQNTKITEAGVKKLSAALPGCKIEWDGGVIELKSPIEAARTAVATLLKKGFRVHLGNIATGELRELKSAVDLNGLGRLYIHSPVKSEQNLYTDPVVLEALRSIPATFTGSQIQVNYPLTGDELGVLVEIPVMRSVGDLYLENTALKDADLKPLAKLANLTGLYFDGSELSDAGLKTLAEIPNLKSLDAGPCKVTSAGLAALRDRKSVV